MTERRASPFAAARPARRSRRQVRPVRRLGDAAGVRRRRRAQGARRGARGGRRLRRVAPGQGPGDRPGRGRLRQRLPHQRPRAGSRRARRSTRCAATTRPAAWSTTSSPTCSRDDHVFLIPNAANTAEVVRRLRRGGAGRDRRSRTSTRRTRCWPCRARARPTSLAALGLPDRARVHELRDAPRWTARDVVVCRTGYTGEHGYELVVPSDDAAAVWDALIAAGARTACGRAAWAPGTRCAPRWATRCTARTCRWTSPRCRPGPAGRSAGPSRRSGAATRCSPEKAAGPRRAAARAASRRPRASRAPHMSVYAGDEPVGEITSGTFSPTRKVGIALALLDTAAGLEDGDTGRGGHPRPARGEAGGQAAVRPAVGPLTGARAQPSNQRHQRDRGGHLDRGAQDVAGDPAEPAYGMADQQQRDRERRRRRRPAPATDGPATATDRRRRDGDGEPAATGPATVPATSAPRPSGRAAGTPRRQAQVAASRPVAQRRGQRRRRRRPGRGSAAAWISSTSDERRDAERADVRPSS